MADTFKRALTRRRRDYRHEIVEEEPDERLVLAVKFLICLLFSMTGLEVAHLVVLHTWNSEVFAGITGLAGTLTGLVMGQKAT